MKDYFGTNLNGYKKRELALIHTAVSYQMLLNKFYLIWNVTFMSAGVIFVYVNANWFTTYEMLGFLGLFWGVSGLPFFLLKDQVKRRFAGQLPSDDVGVPPLPIELLKLLAGFAIGAWATHVMLISTAAKHFDLKHYAKNVLHAYEQAPV